MSTCVSKYVFELGFLMVFVSVYTFSTNIITKLFLFPRHTVLLGVISRFGMTFSCAVSL